MTVVAMSHGELSRYDTLRQLERGELRIEDAAMLLGVCRRQVYRLLDRLRVGGPEVLVSWKRGRTSNRGFVGMCQRQWNIPQKWRSNIPHFAVGQVL